MIKNFIKWIAILIVTLCGVLVASGSSHAQVNVYENDFDGWVSQVENDTILIDFDSIEGSNVSPINGDEFSNKPGSPIISLVVGEGVFVGNPTNQIPTPPSGINMLHPGREDSVSIEGVLKVTFDEPVYAFGATFVDVEADFNSTGFSTNIGNTLPDISFTSSQGQGAFSFLGFSSEMSFTEIDIHFATGANIDGTLLDDLVYSLVTSTSNEAESVGSQEY